MIVDDYDYDDEDSGWMLRDDWVLDSYLVSMIQQGQTVRTQNEEEVDDGKG